MAEEVELKLTLPESAHRRFLQSPILRQASSHQRGRLINIYYDTPALDLHRKAIALRLRRQGKIWLQTIKCAAPSIGGLSSRPEWEAPYDGHFDFSLIDARDVRKWLDRPKIRSRITPVFETNFLRNTWQFHHAPGTILLLMLDRGWIVAAGRREAISEVEIELVSGDTAQLFDLAQQLAEHLPLAPASRSKAERGYRLFLGTPSMPVKAEPAALAAEVSPLAAFRRVAQSCLRQIELNHAGAIASDDPEYIHQMRVGTRRLRACLRLFSPCLPADIEDEVLPPLRHLMARLGHARDLDVLLTEITNPVLTALPDEPRLAALAGLVTNQRHRARGQAIRTLLAPAYGQLMLRIAAWLHSLDEPPATTIMPLAKFADARLRRLRKKVRALSAAAQPENPGSLHAVRIAIKRLRYALEFFLPLVPGKTWRRVIQDLAAAQNTLGQINDLTNAGRLFDECVGEDVRLREATSLVGNWHRPRHAHLSVQVPILIHRLRRLPRIAVT